MKTHSTTTVQSTSCRPVFLDSNKGGQPLLPNSNRSCIFTILRTFDQDYDDGSPRPFSLPSNLLLPPAHSNPHLLSTATTRDEVTAHSFSRRKILRRKTPIPSTSIPTLLPTPCRKATLHRYQSLEYGRIVSHYSCVLYTASSPTYQPHGLSFHNRFDFASTVSR